MKALVCGNAPCLTNELKGKELHEYFTVRMNGYTEPPYMPCKAWSSWPDPSHRLHHNRHEPMYDVSEYAQNCEELWLVHPGVIPLAVNKFKRIPDFILSKQGVVELTKKVGSPPNMGMLMIKACMEQKRFDEIFVAGFDFYESPNDYYFIEGKFDHPAHNQADNKRWFMKQVEHGRIKNL